MTQTQIPSKAQILEWVSDNPDANSKRDIAKAFGIKGAARIELKRLLKELEAEGHLERRRRHYLDAETLPPVTVLELLAPDLRLPFLRRLLGAGFLKPSLEGGLLLLREFVASWFSSD